MCENLRVEQRVVRESNSIELNDKLDKNACRATGHVIIELGTNKYSNTPPQFDAVVDGDELVNGLGRTM